MKYLGEEDLPRMGGAAHEILREPVPTNPFVTDPNTGAITLSGRELPPAIIQQALLDPTSFDVEDANELAHYINWPDESSGQDIDTGNMTKRPKPRWQRLAWRMGTCAAGGAIAALPVAAIYGVTTAKASTEVGTFPVDIQLAPGHTELDTGIIAGSFYSSDFTKYGVGIRVATRGLPENVGDIHSFDSPELQRMVKTFADISSDSSSVQAGITEAIIPEVLSRAYKMEIGAGAVLALTALGITSLDSRKSRRLIASTAILTLLAGSYSAKQFVDWQTDNQIPSQTYQIDMLKGTPLENVQASSKTATEVAAMLVPAIQDEIKREEIANQLFLDNAHKTIDRQIEQGVIVPPNENETTVIIMGDMHGNQDAIKTYQYLVSKVNQTYGDGTLGLALFTGDQTYGGAADKGSVDEIGKIAEDAFAIDGNHDSAITNKQMSAAGIQLIADTTIETPQGIKVVGVTDPDITEQSTFYSARNTKRPGYENESQADAGLKLQQLIDTNHPNIALIHEPDGLAPLLGIKKVTKDTMDTWFAKNNSFAGNAPDAVPDIATGLLAYSHWHRTTQYSVVSNSDGSWTLVLELGSAGGAPNMVALTQFMTNNTIPARQATAALVTINNDSGLATGVQVVKTDRDGTFQAQPLQQIGSVNGQPYPTAVHEGGQ